ncbi:hypothetical protein V5799_025485 [Amblyomma americanum]|uniref:Uncharacterized protein n=1 Tax=Amblyomma americanum TaxID=6943 RepID=A0AAQ4E9E7_AMBAM
MAPPATPARARRTPPRRRLLDPCNAESAPNQPVCLPIPGPLEPPFELRDRVSGIAATTGGDPRGSLVVSGRFLLTGT